MQGTAAALDAPSRLVLWCKHQRGEARMFVEISNVPRDANDKPRTPVTINSVTISTK